MRGVRELVSSAGGRGGRRAGRGVRGGRGPLADACSCDRDDGDESHLGAVAAAGVSRLALDCRIGAHADNRVKNGSAIEVCSGPITLTATGGQKIGSASYSVVTGKQTTVTIPLAAAGQSLLSKSYKLTATLSLAGTTALTRTVRFHYPRIVAPISYIWEFTRSYTTATKLGVSAIPAGGTVKATCHGGGCPFASNTFSPSGGDVNLEPSLNGSHLRPGTTLELDVTAINDVGKVAIFTILSGQLPTLVEKCLPPGATHPSHCA